MSVFAICREIQGTRRQDRILQGLFLRCVLLPRHHLDPAYRRNEARFEFGWILIPRLHVVQGFGGRQEHRRRCYPVDDVLDHFLLHQPFGRHIPFLAQLGKLFLYDQGSGCNLVVPPKDHWRTGYLQQRPETLPFANDGRLFDRDKEARVNIRITVHLSEHR